MLFMFLPCFIAIFRTASKMLTRTDEVEYLFFFQSYKKNVNISLFSIASTIGFSLKHFITLRNFLSHGMREVYNYVILIMQFIQ